MLENLTDRPRPILSALLAAACIANGQAVLAADAHDAGLPWPRPIPCRIQDGPNRDLLVMTLGDVQTPLADGTFNPVSDEVKLKDGTVKENYYRDVLGVKYYQPLDKSRFPVPPSGWCTWYYYYSRITAVEVKRNADWIAANLKDYGAKYVQIDDGWQGAGGRDGGRDWTKVNPERFPLGMADLAAYIKADRPDSRPLAGPAWPEQSRSHHQQSRRFPAQAGRILRFRYLGGPFSG